MRLISGKYRIKPSRVLRRRGRRCAQGNLHRGESRLNQSSWQGAYKDLPARELAPLQAHT
eukprot:scaffold343008_cov11-Prasinocladus_malaysianus.AAC.1